MYIPTFERIVTTEGLTLSVAAGPLCPWQQGLYYLIGVQDCQPKHKDWYGGLVDTLHPDVIVLVHRPIDDMANAPPVISSGRMFQPGDDGFEQALTDESAKSIAKLQGDGRKLVIIEPIPIAAKDADPINCLSSTSNADNCIYQATPQSTPLENFYRAEAAQGSVWSSVDLDELICPRLPTCDPVVDGLIVKRDSNHITGTYAAHIAPRVDEVLRQDGVLP